MSAHQIADRLTQWACGHAEKNGQVQIAVRISPELFYRIKDQAISDDVPINTVIRACIKQSFGDDTPISGEPK